MTAQLSDMAAGFIDVHAHVVMPEIYEQTKAHSVFTRPPEGVAMTEAMQAQAAQRAESVVAAMADVDARIEAMNEMDVGVQVLSVSLVHQCTYFAAPRESLVLEQRANDRLCELVARAPSRFLALGGVPLHAQDLAVAELRRVMGLPGFVGVGISTMAGDMEIGDKRLRPFWEEAEALGALVYIHPAGNHDPRFRKHFLWNSVGQSFEEAMAIASLMYEGILEDYPRLRICMSHGGGYMPYYMGRIERNWIEKPTTRQNMKRPPAEYLRALWYDSCVYDPRALRVLADTVGANRIVLGTDYPVGDRKPAEFIASCGFEPAVAESILRGNAQRMLAGAE